MCFLLLVGERFERGEIDMQLAPRLAQIRVKHAVTIMFLGNASLGWNSVFVTWAKKKGTWWWHVGGGRDRCMGMEVNR